MVLWQGIRLAATGAVLGAIASLGLVRFMSTLLYGIKPIDPVVICLACVTLGVVAVLAAYLPAHRAAKLDPIEVLRSE